MVGGEPAPCDQAVIDNRRFAVSAGQWAGAGPHTAGRSSPDRMVEEPVRELRPRTYPLPALRSLVDAYQIPFYRTVGVGRRVGDSRIQIDFRSIEAATLAIGNPECGDGDVWVHFRTGDCAFDDFGHALNAVHELGETHGAFGYGPYRVPTGLVFRVEMRDSAGFETWMTLLVGNLEGMGATGRIEGAIPASGPDDWQTADPTPAAFLAWSEDGAPNTHPSTSWHVTRDATERITDHAAAWTSSGGDHSTIAMGPYRLEVTQDAEVAAMLRFAVTGNSYGDTIRHQPNERRGRIASLGPRGRALMQVLGAHIPWQDRLAAIRDALSTAPSQDLDLAFIRSSVRFTTSWQQLDFHQKLPNLLESDILQPSPPVSIHPGCPWHPDSHGTTPQPRPRPLVVGHPRTRPRPIPR